MAATKEGSAMQKKYIVRLTDVERATLTEVVKKLNGSSQKVRRAQILLKLPDRTVAVDQAMEQQAAPTSFKFRTLFGFARLKRRPCRLHREPSLLVNGHFDKTHRGSSRSLRKARRMRNL